MAPSTAYITSNPVGLDVGELFYPCSLWGPARYEVHNAQWTSQIITSLRRRGRTNPWFRSSQDTSHLRLETDVIQLTTVEQSRALVSIELGRSCVQNIFHEFGVAEEPHNDDRFALLARTRVRHAFMKLTLKKFTEDAYPRLPRVL